MYKLYLIWSKCHSACYWALPVANLILIQFSAKLDSKKHCSNAKTNIFGVFTDSLERCPHPGIPINGYLLTTSNFTVGSIAEFSCQPGFTLIGHKRQECLFFLQWSGGGAPQCTSELLFCHQFLSFSFSGYQTFSDRVPFVGPVLSARNTLFQENSIFQILFDQKFGKPELTQFRHEQNVCENLWPFLKPTSTQKFRNLLTKPD